MAADSNTLDTSHANPDLRTTATTPSKEAIPKTPINDLDLHAFHNYPEPASPIPAPKNISPIPTRYPETLGSLIEIRESEGKGMGIFAIKDILPGTILLCEVPMFVMEDEDEIKSLFEGLAIEKQEVFLGLSGHIDDEAPGYRSGEETSEQKPETKMEAKLDGIVACNAFSIAHRKAGIFETASRINHSCVPNSCYRFRDSIGRLVVWNRWKLREGEEVLIDYGHSRRTLMESYGFECDCGVCSVEEFEGHMEI